MARGFRGGFRTQPEPKRSSTSIATLAREFKDAFPAPNYEVIPDDAARSVWVRRRDCSSSVGVHLSEVDRKGIVEVVATARARLEACS
jgi:hypothetical protein